MRLNEHSGVSIDGDNKNFSWILTENSIRKRLLKVETLRKKRCSRVIFEYRLTRSDERPRRMETNMFGCLVWKVLIQKKVKYLHSSKIDRRRSSIRFAIKVENKHHFWTSYNSLYDLNIFFFILEISSSCVISCSSCGYLYRLKYNNV